MTDGLRKLSPEDFGLVKPAQLLPDGLDEFERNKRRGQVQITWNEVPRHQLAWRIAPEFREAVDSWPGDRSLVLLGPTGTGKTSACVRLVARLIRDAIELGGAHIHRARSTCWTDAGSLGRAGGEDDLDSKHLLSRARAARVLVLDDVATPRATIQETLRARLSGGLATILTSGATSVPGLQDALGGDAVLRHVLEATGTKGRIVIAKEVPR